MRLWVYQSKYLSSGASLLESVRIGVLGSTDSDEDIQGSALACIVEVEVDDGRKRIGFRRDPHPAHYLLKKLSL